MFVVPIQGGEKNYSGSPLGQVRPVSGLSVLQPGFAILFLYPEDFGFFKP